MIGIYDFGNKKILKSCNSYREKSERKGEL